MSSLSRQQLETTHLSGVAWTGAYWSRSTGILYSMDFPLHIWPGANSSGSSFQSIARRNEEPRKFLHDKRAYRLEILQHLGMLLLVLLKTHFCLVKEGQRTIVLGVDTSNLDLRVNSTHSLLFLKTAFKVEPAKTTSHSSWRCVGWQLSAQLIHSVQTVNLKKSPFHHRNFKIFFFTFSHELASVVNCMSVCIKLSESGWIRTQTQFSVLLTFSRGLVLVVCCATVCDITTSAANCATFTLRSKQIAFLLQTGKVSLFFLWQLTSCKGLCFLFNSLYGMGKFLSKMWVFPCCEGWLPIIAQLSRSSTFFTCHTTWRVVVCKALVDL